MAPTSSFDFPGWKFSGERPPRRAPPATPATAARNWIDDLDDLEGGSDSGSEADACNAQVGAHAEEALQDVASAAGDGSWLDGVWPEDVLFAVLSVVGQSMQELCTARAVSLRWRDAASSDILWKRLWDTDCR